MTVNEKIQALITAANAVTGESDTDLTSAVQHLKDGYGQGGTDDWDIKVKGCEMMEINSKAFESTNITVADLSPKISRIGYNAFYYTSELEKLILRRNEVVSISNDAETSFRGSLILEGWEDHIGIFVPDELCSAYAEDVNWCSLYWYFNEDETLFDDIPYYPFIPLSRLEGNNNG